MVVVVIALAVKYNATKAASWTLKGKFKQKQAEEDEDETVDDQVAVFITPAGKQVLLNLHVDLLTEFPKQ